MKVGILGSGFMGRTHARAYAKMKGVEVAAISSLHLERAETLANEVGGRATTDNLAIIDAEGGEACAPGEAVCAHRRWLRRYDRRAEGKR